MEYQPSDISLPVSKSIYRVSGYPLDDSGWRSYSTLIPFANVEDYLNWLFLNGNRVKDGDRNGWRKMLPGQSDISQGRIYREMLRTAKADSDRNERYVLRGQRD